VLNIIRRVVFRFIWVGIIATLLFSCKSTEKVTTARKIRHMSCGRILKNVSVNEPSYENMSVKRVSVSVEAQGKSHSFRASYRIKRDSVIQINAQKATIPVGKLEITPDTFRAVYYIDKEYYEGALNYLSKRLGMDIGFDMFEAIFTNQLFSFRNDPKDRDFRDFHCVIDDGMYRISSMKDRKLRKVIRKEEKLERYRNRFDEEHLIRQDIYVDPNRFVIRKLVFNDIDYNRTMSLDFSHFEMIDGRWFPEEIRLNYTGKENYEVKVKLSRISFDQPESFNFRIPSKYKQILLN
jgi:hypothetical protein